MTINSLGNVGIGTDNPDGKLEVNGEIKTTDLTVTGKINFGKYEITKDGTEKNQKLIIKHKDVPEGIQIGMYETGGNGLFIAPTTNNHGSLGHPSYKFDDILGKAP